jgi:hypothetical protein
MQNRPTEQTQLDEMILTGDVPDEVLEAAADPKAQHGALSFAQKHCSTKAVSDGC